MRRVKIYGICLERLADLISKAKERLNGNGYGNRVLLESYRTGDINDLVYILELFDLDEQTQKGLREELDRLAYAISVLTHEILTFGYTEEGHLGLYLTVTIRAPHSEELVGARG